MSTSTLSGLDRLPLAYNEFVRGTSISFLSVYGYRYCQHVPRMRIVMSEPVHHHHHHHGTTVHAVRCQICRLTLRGTLRLHTSEAVLEFYLSSLELCERRGEVLHLLIELLLYCRELLGAQAVEAHCGLGVSMRLR